MSPELHPKPNLDQLKLQAKELRKAYEHGDKGATKQIKLLLPRLKSANDEEILAATFSLAEAQLVVARHYGFDSWPKLKHYIESIRSEEDATVYAFLNSACPEANVNHRSGTLEKAQAILAENPGIAKVNIHAAAVLGDPGQVKAFLKADPALTRAKGGPRNWEPLLYLCFSRFLRFQGQQTERFMETAHTLLAHGADPNAFFMCGEERETALYGAAGVVNNAQLMRVLLEAGADPNDPDAHYHVAEFDKVACFRLFFDYGIDAMGRATMLLRNIDMGRLLISLIN